MRIFRGRHFSYEIIVWAIRWYCKYGISYRDLEEMLYERGVEVDHSTIYRWVQRYMPVLEKKMKWYVRPTLGMSWRVDETYVKVKGRWVYLYRALDKIRNTIDFYLSTTRNATSARIFLQKVLRSLPQYAQPICINTDKNPAYAKAIDNLKKQGKCREGLEHRQVKYLNNIIESDHGKLKRLIKPTLGFKNMKDACATIKGFEVMRMFKKGQMIPWQYGRGVFGEIDLITKELIAA